MKQFFLSIGQQLSSLKQVDGVTPLIPYVRRWNNQLEKLFDESGARVESFAMPAVFPAFVRSEIKQLGKGVQMYDPLIFDLHILDWQLDASDGTFEQNLEVEDLKQKIYGAIQKFQPGITDTTNPAGACVRISEEEDNNHRGVFHFIQRYRTTYIDNQQVEPIGQNKTEFPLGLELDLTVFGSTDPSAPHIYTFTYAVYTFDNSTGGSPASGKLQLDNTDPTLATTVYINNLDAHNLIISDILAEVEIGDTIKIIKDGSNQWIYKVTAITPVSGQTNFAVTYVSKVGAINNLDTLKIIIL